MTARHVFKALSLGLVLFCVSFAFFGGIIADDILMRLNCRPHSDPRVGSCGMFANALGLRLMPFLSADTPMDYPFMLLRQFPGLILTWLLAIGAVRWLAAHPHARTSIARPQAISRTPRQTAHLAGTLAFWMLFTGFIIFCVAFATPFLGSHVAREILQALGCSPGTFDPFTTPCMSEAGFWTPRLRPFLIPLMGQWLSPLWLFWQFGDVLLAWAALTGAVFAWKEVTAPRPVPSDHGTPY